MSLDEKARENLDAAERLLPSDDGAQDALCNASVSRAYYAGYLAAAAVARAGGVPFTDSAASYYRHDSFPEIARACGILDDDGSETLALLYGRRIKADYDEAMVELDEASESWELARDLVARLLGRGER